MISFVIAYDPSGNIGKCYNREMAKLDSDDDFICFLDADAMFTAYSFYDQLAAIVKNNPECGLFVGKANRIGCLWQRAGDWNTDDMKWHRELGKEIAESNLATAVEDVTDKGKREPLGGFLIMIRKSTWKKIGGFKETGQLGVDNDIHYKAIRANEKVYLMKGVYLYHWYRGGDANNKNHISKAR